MEEVPDEGQNCISLKWLIKKNLVDSEKFIKARLCARGFEEDQNIRTTCYREGLRLTSTLRHLTKEYSIVLKNTKLLGLLLVLQTMYSGMEMKSSHAL